MNSYNYNNNNNINRNQMPPNNNGFFVDFLQGMYNNNNSGNNQWNNNGYDDNYYNDNYNGTNPQDNNYNNYNNNNNNNNNDNYTTMLSAFEFRKYQRFLNAGFPRHVALSKATFHPSGKRKISESQFQIPHKKPNITVRVKNTVKSAPPVSKARSSISNKQNTSIETKRNVSSTSVQKPKTTTSQSSTPKRSNNKVKEKSAEQAKKNNASNDKQSNQKPKTAADSEINSAKNNDKTPTTEISPKNKSSKQSSTSSSTSSTAKEISTSTTTRNSNKETPSSSNSNSRNINSKNGSSISNNKTTTKTPSTMGTLGKTNENTSSSQEQENETSKDKTIRIGIMAKGFPNVVLDQNELEKLEEAMVQAMSEGWTSKLIFDGIIYRPGVLLIDCSNHKTASWLTLSIKNLPNWQGADLEARFGYNMPDVKFITIYLPKAAHRGDEFLLRLLSAQNEGLHVKLWTVCCSIAQGQGKLMTIGVDDMSFENIKKCDFLLRYRFGKIMVHTQTPGNIVSDPVADESAANHSMSEDFELDEEDLNGIEECFFTVKTEKPD